MDSKGDNVEIIMGIETDYIIEEHFRSFLENYQRNLEEKMKDSNFVYESVDFSLHKISLNRGGSYRDSPSWIKLKKLTINPKSKDNKCFRDATGGSLNYERIPNNPERISNFKPFFDQYNWVDKEFPSHSILNK